MINGKKTYTVMLSIALVLSVLVSAVSFSASVSYAAPAGLEARGQINSAIGAFMRAKASKSSRIVAGLKNNTTVTIKKEVFVTRYKTSAKKRWYYVSDGKHTGYVRADLVKNIVYPTASAITKAKVYYRYGAGTSMKKKGHFKKKKTVTVVLEAKACKSGKVWYKIKSGSKYYYVSGSKISITKVTPLPKQASASAPQSSGSSGSSSSGKGSSTGTQSAAAAKVAAGACTWAVKIANDNSFHYGNTKHCLHNGCYFCGTQPKSKKKYVVQWEKTYCCNPFITAAYAHGGNEPFMLSLCKKGKSYMAPEFTKSALFANLGHPAQSTLKQGDILCSDVHVAMYIGNGKLVEAAARDNGVPGSSSWNSSIRVTSLSAKRYKGFPKVFRYIG